MTAHHGWFFFGLNNSFLIPNFMQSSRQKFPPTSGFWEVVRNPIWVEKSARLRNLIILVIFPEGLKYSATSRVKFQSFVASTTSFHDENKFYILLSVLCKIALFLPLLYPNNHLQKSKCAHIVLLNKNVSP